MKILHLGKYFAPFSGGLENYMRDAMVALARLGIDSLALVHQHAFSFRTRDETFSTDGYDFQIVRTGMWARFMFTPFSPALPWHLRRMIKTAKPDILHLHLPNASAFWALVLPSARRIPWVVHWHADVITSAQGWWMSLFYMIYQPFESAVLKRASVIVATSMPYRASSQPLKRWLSKCQVVPLGVDTRRYVNSIHQTDTPSPSAALALQPLKVLAVGRLTYYKGFRYLIEAAAKVEDCHVSLVGLGEQAEKLKELVASLSLQERVTFHGSLSDSELAKLMEYCDCLCLPSIERTEAFGMVLLEAMFFGKATIIGDVEGSGMGWVVDDGVTGLKVKPADAETLAEAIEKFASNRAKMIQMGQAGREKFDRHFEINRSITPLVDIYQQVLIRMKHEKLNET